MDVGYSGVWFTWERGNLPETNIKERLDRGVVNDSWMDLFPNVCVRHFAYFFSNHCSLLIYTAQQESNLRKYGFRFEAWWVLEESFMDKV